MAPFLALDNLKPFVDSDLADSTKPIVFRVSTGSRAYGYKAELLPRVCEVYLKARDAGALLRSQLNMAKACEILMRALAHVGIVALVDEAACAMFLAYYNFCWRTRDVVNGRNRLPAAMAAGVVDRLWSFEDLFDAVMGGRPAIAA